MPLHLAFIDYTKAFDSIETTAVVEALENQSIPTTYINMLKHIYNHCFAFIRQYEDSTTFQLHKGVRQGDPISPKLFTASLEEIFRNLNWEEKEFEIKIDGEYLSYLRFADDILLVPTSCDQLQNMIDE